VTHRVQQHVDAERIAVRRELLEVSRVLTLALPRVLDVGVVGHQDHDSTVVIGNRTHVRYRAVGSLLRRASARAHEEIDARDLWDLGDFELRQALLPFIILKFTARYQIRLNKIIFSSHSAIGSPLASTLATSCL
jgi:hypothetical protein